MPVKIGVMEFTSTVLYQKRLTYYDIHSKDGWTYTARLLNPDHLFQPSPPAEVQLYKEGLIWYGNADPELVHYLGKDIDHKLPYYLNSVEG